MAEAQRKRQRPVTWSILDEPRPLSCQPCRLAHRNCGGGRPCDRCARTGHAEQCFSTHRSHLSPFTPALVPSRCGAMHSLCAAPVAKPRGRKPRIAMEVRTSFSHGPYTAPSSMTSQFFSSAVNTHSSLQQEFLWFSDSSPPSAGSSNEDCSSGDAEDIMRYLNMI